MTASSSSRRWNTNCCCCLRPIRDAISRAMTFWRRCAGSMPPSSRVRWTSSSAACAPSSATIRNRAGSSTPYGDAATASPARRQRHDAVLLVFAVAAVAGHLPAAGGAVRMGRGRRHPLGLQRRRPAHADQRSPFAAHRLRAPGHRLATASGSGAGHHPQGASGHSHLRTRRALVLGSGFSRSSEQWSLGQATISAPNQAPCSTNCAGSSSRCATVTGFSVSTRADMRSSSSRQRLRTITRARRWSRFWSASPCCWFCCAYLAVRGLFRPIATIRQGAAYIGAGHFEPSHPHAPRRRTGRAGAGHQPDGWQGRRHAQCQARTAAGSEP